MAKKRSVVKKKEKVDSPVKTEPKEKKDSMEKILIENFVSLQKVMTNVALNFDNLSGQISKLLGLFEISAKALAEKEYSAGEKADPKLMEKLNTLIDNNKVIAKGIAMLYEKTIPEEPEETPVQRAPPQQYQIQQQKQVSQEISRMPPVDFSKTQKFGNLEA
jgi:hypothetical protein